MEAKLQFQCVDAEFEQLRGKAAALQQLLIFMSECKMSVRLRAL